MEGRSVTEPGFWAQEACGPYWLILVAVALTALVTWVLRGFFTKTEKIRLGIIPVVLLSLFATRVAIMRIAAAIAEATGHPEIAGRLATDDWWIDLITGVVLFVLVCTDFATVHTRRMNLADVRHAVDHPDLDPDALPVGKRQRYVDALAIVAVVESSGSRGRR